MSRTNFSLTRLGLTMTFTFLPAVLATQSASAQHDMNACPPGVMTASEILVFGPIPYGGSGASISNAMLGLETIDRTSTLGMLNHGLKLEVMEYQPNRLIALQRQLELSPEQVSELEELITDRGNVEQDMRINTQAAINQLAASLKADQPDTAAVRRDAMRLASQRDALYAELVVNAAAGRRLLTEQQREELVNGPCGLQHVRRPSALGQRNR